MACSGRALLDETEIVAPVSNEMMCSDCHEAEAGGTLKRAILRAHDDEEGTDLLNNRPVLCAVCHAETPDDPGPHGIRAAGR